MSKASEWAGPIDPPKLVIGSIVALAIASGGGIVGLQLYVCQLSAPDACALARWILDTFDEPAPAAAPREDA